MGDISRLKAIFIGENYDPGTLRYPSENRENFGKIDSFQAKFAVSCGKHWELVHPSDSPDIQNGTMEPKRWLYPTVTSV